MARLVPLFLVWAAIFAVILRSIRATWPPVSTNAVAPERNVAPTRRNSTRDNSISRRQRAFEERSTISRYFSKLKQMFGVKKQLGLPFHPVAMLETYHLPTMTPTEVIKKQKLFRNPRNSEQTRLEVELYDAYVEVWNKRAAYHQSGNAISKCNVLSGLREVVETDPYQLYTYLATSWINRGMSLEMVFHKLEFNDQRHVTQVLHSIHDDSAVIFYHAFFDTFRKSRSQDLELADLFVKTHGLEFVATMLLSFLPLETIQTFQSYLKRSVFRLWSQVDDQELLFRSIVSQVNFRELSADPVIHLWYQYLERQNGPSAPVVAIDLLIHLYGYPRILATFSGGSNYKVLRLHQTLQKGLYTKFILDNFSAEDVLHDLGLVQGELEKLEKPLLDARAEFWVEYFQMTLKDSSDNLEVPKDSSILYFFNHMIDISVVEEKSRWEELKRKCQIKKPDEPKTEAIGTLLEQKLKKVTRFKRDDLV
ncbi:hypothetical protein CCR75_002528 [Bremia lactucae]|uniref:RxLR effector protein n=1 Tax=Bremia lactucae TaxID=4779 RepID=A0A976II78_BRELC|nr:hypothetical protein CCR75_002528 [Bremia lactucae]